MPRKSVKILKADSKVFILETSIRVHYRFSIPKATRSRIDPNDKVRITIEKVEEVKE